MIPMGLKLRLMRDDEILFEIPLDQNTSHNTLINEFSEIDNEVFISQGHVMGQDRGIR